MGRGLDGLNGFLGLILAKTDSDITWVCVKHLLTRFGPVKMTFAVVGIGFSFELGFDSKIEE